MVRKKIMKNDRPYIFESWDDPFYFWVDNLIPNISRLRENGGSIPIVQCQKYTDSLWSTLSRLLAISDSVVITPDPWGVSTGCLLPIRERLNEEGNTGPFHIFDMDIHFRKKEDGTLTSRRFRKESHPFHMGLRGININAQIESSEGGVHDAEVELLVNDPRGLLKWLPTIKPAIEAGLVVFLPYYSIRGEAGPIAEEAKQTYHSVIENMPLLQNNVAPPFRATFERPFKDNTLGQLLTLQLPFVDNIKPDLFVKIRNDNQDAFVRFRNYVNAGIDDLKDAVDSEDYSKKLKKIKRDCFDDALANLNIRYNTILKARSLQAAGCVLASAGLLASSLMGHEFNELLRAALGAGGVKLSLDTASSYVEDLSKLKEDKSYFLWKLSRASRKS